MGNDLKKGAEAPFSIPLLLSPAYATALATISGCRPMTRT